MRRALADEANSQSVNHPLQRQLLRVLDLAQNVLRRLLAHALQLEQFVFRQAVEIGDVFHQPGFDQLIDQRVAHAIDVHHPARGEVANALAQLGRTIRIHAAMIGLAFGAHHVAAAHRAALRHVKMTMPTRLVFQHLHDFGNYVAAALDQHPVADAHSQPIDLVHVVQRGAADRGAADRHGLEPCHRSQLAGAAHLHLDVFNLRLTRMRGVLVGDRPARGFAGEAQLLLQPNAVDLHHDAVSFVGQAVTLAFPLHDEVPYALDVCAPAGDWDSP